MDHATWRRFLLLLLTGLFGLLLIGESILSSSRWINQSFPGVFLHENLTVGPYSLPGWTGANAGLQSLDRVVSVAEQPLRQRAEMYELVRRMPVGSAIRYQVVRDSRLRDYTIATMSFTFSDWLFSFGVYNVIGLAFLVIGIAPYFYRASSPVALPLCFMVLSVFVWFQTTFDFMTASFLPKELRIFQYPGPPALHRNHLRRRTRPRSHAKPNLLWPPRHLDRSFSRRLYLCFSRRRKLSFDHRKRFAP